MKGSGNVHEGSGKGLLWKTKSEVMGWETWHEMEKDRNLGKNAKTSRNPDVYE